MSVVFSQPTTLATLATLELFAPTDLLLREKELFYIVSQQVLFSEKALRITTPALHIPVGSLVSCGDTTCLVSANSYFPTPHGPAEKQLLLQATADTTIAKGHYSCSVTKKAYSLAWIVLSDKGAAGKRVDACGPLIEKLIKDTLKITYTQGYLLPDQAHSLQALLYDLCLTQQFDLVITSGGTGVGPRDITPETTLGVIEKHLPGFEHAMTACSLNKTPHGAISRAVAGTLANSLLINLPGSPQAVEENLQALLPAIDHTIKKLQGDMTDCF